MLLKQLEEKESIVAVSVLEKKKIMNQSAINGIQLILLVLLRY